MEDPMQPTSQSNSITRRSLLRNIGHGAAAAPLLMLAGAPTHAEAVRPSHDDFLDRRVADAIAMWQHWRAAHPAISRDEDAHGYAVVDILDAVSQNFTLEDARELVGDYRVWTLQTDFIANDLRHAFELAIWHYVGGRLDEYVDAVEPRQARATDD